MKKVVGILLDEKEKIVFFDSNNIDLEKDNYVVVEVNQSSQFGKVAIAPYEVSDEDIGLNLNLVIRKANNKDKKNYEQNKKDSGNALIEARKIVSLLDLNMKIIDASYTFDRSQLLFHFLADSRIDFRELAKKLASIFCTRIELRQIGVRDKAKMIGGIGPCGRFLCCSTFLTDFNSVSINMAKNQMLALNPNKINGICGRLLCCLGYEDDIYTELKKDMPSIGQFYKNNSVEGKVVSLNLLKKTITVETKNKSLIEVQI